MQGTIVIADSSPVFRHGLEQILLKRGNDTTVVHAESGEELQAVLIPNAPELVIIDCMAPKFSVDDVLACQRVQPHVVPHRAEHRDGPAAPQEGARC